MAKDGNKKLDRKDKGTWIPKKLFVDHSLTLAEIVTLAEIDALDGEDSCFAMNKHFAERLRVTADRAGDIISGLVKKGRITRQILPSAKGKRRFLSVVKKTESHTVKMPDGHTVEMTYPSLENTGGHTVKMPDAILEENTRENTIEGEGQSPPVLSEKEERQKLGNMARTGKLSPEERSRFSYLNAKKEKAALGDEFFGWFETEVLSRFDKFTPSAADLGDWYVHLFKPFDIATASAAVSLHRVNVKGWNANLTKVIDAAKEIVNETKKQKARDEKSTRQKPAENQKSAKEVYAGHSDKEIEDLYKKTVGDGDYYTADIIKREIARRKNALTTKDAKTTKKKKRPQGHITTNEENEIVCIN